MGLKIKVDEKKKAIGVYLDGNLIKVLNEKESKDFMENAKNEILEKKGMFNPEFHIQCRYATAPIEDDLPHYKGIPARFKGSDELMQW